MEELIIKLEELILLLKNNNKMAYKYFEDIKIELLEGKVAQAIEKLLKSYSIVQYGDFNYQEEGVYDQVYNLAKLLIW